MPEMPNVVAGNTIESAWGNAIRDRTVQRYASAAARTTAHPSPTAGDLSYLADSDSVEVFDGSNWIPLAVAQSLDIGGADDAVIGNLTTSYQVGASVTFTKPSWWNTYKLMAWGSLICSQNIDPLSSSDVRVTIDANAGTVMSASGGSSPDVYAVSARHQRTGLTASALVQIEAKKTGSGVINAQASVINYIAIRLT